MFIRRMEIPKDPLRIRKLEQKKKNNSPCISGVISPLSLPCIYLFLPQCTEAAMLQEPTELPSLPST